MSPIELPDKLIADTLNSRARNQERGHRGDDSIPRLHVSSLIKSSSTDFFCAREFVLRYMERREIAGNAIPPKFALLYAVGHFYGDFIVSEFIARNSEYAQYVYGDWTCDCKRTVETRKTLAQVHNQYCPHCQGSLTYYKETDLFNPDKTVVGHADLILCVDDHYYIYEFKTIDRADIVFSEINDPLGDHLLQASNYYYMLKSEGKKVSKRIRFVYVDRSMAGLYTDNPFREVYGVAASAERLTAIYDRAKLCHSSIQKGKLPPRKCAAIDCTRAKTCTVAVSCFNRKLGTIKRTPLELTLPSRRAASISSQSTMTTGSASPSVPKSKTVRTRPASLRSAKKLSKGSKT